MVMVAWRAEAAARCGWPVPSVVDVPAPLQVEFQQSSLLQTPFLWWRILTVQTVHYR